MEEASSILKPDDQVTLTDSELKEEFTRILTAVNPNAAQNMVRFDFKEGQYKLVPHVDQVAIHFSLEGNLLHKDSEEARLQIERTGLQPLMASESEKGEDESEPKAAPAEEPPAKEEAAEPGDGEQEEKEMETEEEEKQEAEAAQPVSQLEKRPLMNQFNFCERATQTYNNAQRDQANDTEPPPRQVYSANASQWGIFDAYKEDFAHQQSQKKRTGREGRTRLLGKAPDAGPDDLSRISRAVKIVERMVNQNMFDEITQDFKYYEDPSDEHRDQQDGTLLPLWKFSHDSARRLAVTTICWSPKYNDLFVVGHGSYEFMKPVQGMICFYSLKNPSYPEYIFETDSGVLCLDIHPGYPQMLCVGFYNGSVGVYNVVQKKAGPLYASTADSGKHTDPVWQVRWQKDDLDNNLKFFSISSDGRVTSWTLVKEGVGACHDSSNDLVHYDIIRLVHTNADGKMEEDLGIAVSENGQQQKKKKKGCGTSFDFHRQIENLFLVGTEEGVIHKCSKSYSANFLGSFAAHHMAVYRVVWNSFHPDIFITCSADWSVKVWDHKKAEPIFVYDLNSSVGDVAWAPYSSTVFAAVTTDGKIHVFDLNVNKQEAICVQPVVQKKKTKCTRLAFNPVFPVVIVGDDMGHVTSLKLSPNLRRFPKEKKGADMRRGPEIEIPKLDRILATVG